MNVQLTEIIGRSKQGVTTPFFCKCDDGYRYYVKGHHAGKNSLISEWLAGKIGHMLKLNLPEIRIIYVPSGLSRYSARSDIGDLGSLPVFGSRYVDNAREFLYTDIDRMTDADKAKILLFDWWTANTDRILSEHGGNPNLILSSNDDIVWVIDHNLAFHEELTGTFWENHIFAKYSYLWDANFKNTMLPIMQTAQKELVKYWNEMPDEWTTEGSILSLAQAENILSRMDDDKLGFWRN